MIKNTFKYVFIILGFASGKSYGQSLSVDFLIKPTYHVINLEPSRSELGLITQSERMVLDFGLRTNLHLKKWIFSFSSIYRKKRLSEDCPIFFRENTIMPINPFVGYNYERDCNFLITEKSRQINFLLGVKYDFFNHGKTNFFISMEGGSSLILSEKIELKDLPNSSSKIVKRTNQFLDITPLRLSTGVRNVLNQRINLIGEIGYSVYYKHDDFNDDLFQTYDLDIILGVSYFLF